MPKHQANKTTSYQRGIWSEKVAAIFLRTKGYKILTERFRSGKGEIDLVAQKAKRIVFVEVKSRKTMEDGLYAISPRQKGRIIAAAEIWLAQNNIEFEECRFDVVLLTPRSLPTHIKNAFIQE